MINLFGQRFTICLEIRRSSNNQIWCFIRVNKFLPVMTTSGDKGQVWDIKYYQKTIHDNESKTDEMQKMKRLPKSLVT